jgi:hypothetical protein
VATRLVRQLGKHKALIWRGLVTDSKVRERERERQSVGERGRKGGSTMVADCEATMAVNMVGRDAQLMREWLYQLIHRQANTTAHQLAHCTHGNL